MLKKAMNNRRYMCQINIPLLFQVYNWDPIFHGFYVTCEFIRVFEF